MATEGVLARRIPESPNERFGFLISGSLFLPRRSAGTWLNELHTSTFDFEIQSYNWGSVDGLAKLRMCGGVDILGGFRWDHTSTRVRYSDNTDDDYILNAYLPLLGIQIGNNFSGGSFLVHFVGAPKVYGQLRYHFWDNQGFAEFGDFGISDGYFMELLVDYSMRFRGNMNIGGFVKGNSFHCKTDRQKPFRTLSRPCLLERRDPIMDGWRVVSCICQPLLAIRFSQRFAI